MDTSYRTDYNYDLIIMAVEKEKNFVKKLVDLGVPIEKIQKLEFTSVLYH